MNTASTAGSDPAALELRKSLLECSATDAAANRLFLCSVDAKAANVAPFYGEGIPKIGFSLREWGGRGSVAGK